MTDRDPLERLIGIVGMRMHADPSEGELITTILTSLEAAAKSCSV